jgi:hypothetical protein
MGEEARQRVEREFTEEIMFGRVAALYAELLPRPEAARD